MGQKIAAIIGGMLLLIFVYLLVTHGPAVSSITTSGTKGASNIIVALQGNAKQS